MVVNTTTSKESEADIEAKMRQMSNDMRRHFEESPTCTIQILKSKEDKEQSIEGGINGYFFVLKKGVIIPDVPLPILDTLDEAGIQYSRFGDMKPSAKMLAARQAPEAAASKSKSKGKGDKPEDNPPPAE